METFAYTMAGIMILTVLISWFCSNKLRKVAEIPDFYTLDKIVEYSLIVEICRLLVVIEVLILFVSAVICGIVKMCA